MHLRIKVCGVTTAADARMASELGADAIGLNFYPPSPRYLSDAMAIRGMFFALPPFVSAVGVFVNETWEQASAIAEHHGLDIVQLHGDHHETGSRFPLKRIDAFRVCQTSDLDRIKDYLTQAKEMDQLPAAILVDAHVSGQFGGTGHTAPWNLLAELALDLPLILAGGLTPENVAEAVRIVRPYGVDVASGVESSPGVKDRDKVRRFIDNARDAASRLS